MNPAKKCQPLPIKILPKNLHPKKKPIQPIKVAAAAAIKRL